MLYQFPLRELRFFFPGWVETLEQGHWLKQGLTDALKGVMAQVEKLADVEQAIGTLGETDFLKKAYTTEFCRERARRRLRLILRMGYSIRF